MDPDELKATFKTVVEEGLEPVKTELKDIKEKADKIDDLDARVKAIEALPIHTAKAGTASDATKKIYGYKVSKMGREWRSPFSGKTLRQEIADREHEFDAFSDEQKFEEYGEYLLDFVEARCNNNPEAMQKLYNRRKANYAEGTTNSGDELVPMEYQWDMIQLARNRTHALNECTVIPMSRDQLQLPREATMVSVAWKDEAAAAADGEGTLDTVTLTANKLTALATASNELIADSAIDLVGMLTEQFSYAVLLELDNQVFQGTGSPTSGLFKGIAGNSVVLGTGSAHFSMVTADNLSNAISNIEDGYLMNAKFVFGRSLKHYLRVLKDSQGRHIWAMPAQQQPGTVWEYPYIQSEKVPATGASTVAALFGNLRYFYVGRRLGAMTLDVDPYGKFANYQTRFRIVTRFGFAIARPEAFCSVVTSA